MRRECTSNLISCQVATSTSEKAPSRGIESVPVPPDPVATQLCNHEDDESHATG